MRPVCASHHRRTQREENVVSKQALRDALNARRAAALATLEPQWKRCFWTRPLGHIYDNNECLYCGKRTYWSVMGVDKLEQLARHAHNYPIAQDVPKRTVNA